MTRRPLIAVAVVLAVAVVAMAVVLVVMLLPQDRPASEPATITEPAPDLTMRGTITMPLYGPEDEFPNWHTVSGACRGKGGYSDISEGASVTVFDGAGTVVGDSALQAGRAKGSGRTRRCVWAFEVPDLPESDYYQVEVSHRGKVTVKVAELETVGLTIGD